MNPRMNHSKLFYNIYYIGISLIVIYENYFVSLTEDLLAYLKVVKLVYILYGS